MKAELFPRVVKLFYFHSSPVSAFVIHRFIFFRRQPVRAANDFPDRCNINLIKKDINRNYFFVVSLYGTRTFVFNLELVIPECYYFIISVLIQTTRQCIFRLQMLAGSFFHIQRKKVESTLLENSAATPLRNSYFALFKTVRC